LFIAVSDLHAFARIIEGVVVFVVTALGRTAGLRSSEPARCRRATGQADARRLAWSQIAGFEHREAGGWGLDCTMVVGESSVGASDALPA